MDSLSKPLDGHAFWQNMGFEQSCPVSWGAVEIVVLRWDVSRFSLAMKVDIASCPSFCKSDDDWLVVVTARAGSEIPRAKLSKRS